METAISANGRVDRNVRRQRWEWLLKETRERRFVDVLNSEFVDSVHRRVQAGAPNHILGREQMPEAWSRHGRNGEARLPGTAPLRGFPSGALGNPVSRSGYGATSPGKYADLLMSNAGDHATQAVAWIDGLGVRLRGGSMNFDYLALIVGGIGPDVWDEANINAADFMDAAEQAQAEGEAALRRLFDVAQSDTGQCKIIAKFLLGCYNGDRV